MPRIDEDLDVREFAKKLRRLPEHLPISDALEEQDPQKSGHWWNSQREHMSKWFDSQATTGSGAFSRQRPNRSARTTYNRLQHAEGIIWIAEALGVSSEIVQRAADAAIKEPNRKKRPKIVRDHLPWSLVFEKAKFR